MDFFGGTIIYYLNQIRPGGKKNL